MSNKSGIASQVITLPSGGGALNGIGESFKADLFTGTGNATVPIAVPAGRGGLQPSLDLVYSTGNGNGPFGLGWQVSVPQVARKTSRGVPRYGPGDALLLSGMEDLIPVGANRFRPRTEGTFDRIEQVANSDDASGYWRVSSRDGLVSQYSEALADPDDGEKVFCWKLSATSDPFGNRIVYGYQREASQLYLESVRYVDYEPDRFLIEVRFVHEQRPDPFSDRRAGFDIRTTLRCKRIEVRVDDVLSRSYDLDYSSPLNGVSLLTRVRVTGHDGQRTQALPPLEFGYSGFDPRAGRPQVLTGAMPRGSLAQADIELVDLSGNGLPDIVEMSGTTRWWRNNGRGSFDAPVLMPQVPVGVRLGDSGTQFGDLNGNGRADLMVLGLGGYFPMSFTGGFDPQGFVRYPSVPSVPFGDGNLRLMDLDGDGVTDALRTGSSFELFHHDPVVGWDSLTTVPRRPLAEFPDVSFSDPQVKLADLTGDGLQDIVLVEQGRIDYWPYLGHGRWGRRITMAGSPVFRDPVLPPGRFDPRRVLLGDLDGDGLDDVVYVEGNRVTLWLNRGGNGFSEPITLSGTPGFSDADGVRLADLFGTGVAGLLWTRETTDGRGYSFADLTAGVKPYLLTEINNNQGARTRIRYAPSTEYYLADNAEAATRWRTPLPFPVHVVAGIEATDEVSESTLTTEYRYHHGYFDGAEREFRGFGRVDHLDTQHFPGSTSPPLLTKTWFHLGPVGDEFGERTEADFTADYWAHDPQVLPRPEATAALLRSLPATERADALRSLRGTVLRTELYALDGTPLEPRPYTVTEAQHGIRAQAPRVWFPHPVAERSTQWERGTEPMHSFGFTGTYDAYGLAGTQIALAVPRGRDFRVAATDAQPYPGTRTRNEFARRDDQTHYLVDRVARSITHEIVNDGSMPLLDLVRAAEDGTARLAICAESLTFYDGEPFEGLPLGRLGEHGAPSRTQTLAVTAAILRAAFGAIPAYLAAETPQWTEEYPQEFRDLLPPLAGYHRGGNGFYTVTGVRRDPRGLVVAGRDELGRESTTGYDRFGLLPVTVTDPVALSNQTEYDYRVLQPSLSTDPNGNRTQHTYSPLGLPETRAVMGKPGETVGDTEAVPGTRWLYDFARAPVSVRTIRRVHHVNDTDVPAAQRDDTVETVDYSDGFGRLVQTRRTAPQLSFGHPVFGGEVLPAGQTDPGTRLPVTGRSNLDRHNPNVVVSGWKVFDSKGRVVQDYEPFLATGFSFVLPSQAQYGNRIELRYDPRGQLIETIHPDGSRDTVVQGIPADLADPAVFTPTPWEAYTYDRNDNAGRTHAGEADAYREHWNTPSSATVDALGRVVLGVRRLGAEELRARTAYDIRGNVVRVVDAVGRQALRAVHDLAGNALRVEGIDAGLRQVLPDAAGNVVERRDGRGSLGLRAYDVLGRLSRLWARDDAAGEVTLRQHLSYGDGGDPSQPPQERAQSLAANRLRAPHRHRDEAGELEFASYDFKGNELEKTRRVLADDAITGGGGGLDPTPYETSTAYDALSRITAVRYPRDVQGNRKLLHPSYNHAGALDRVTLDGQVIVEHIAHDAKGQRTLIAFGNGLLTRYAYDARTARPTRLRTERFTKPDPLTYQGVSAPVQELAYRYDLQGNILSIVERTPRSGVAGNPDAGGISDPELRASVAAGEALVRAFSYDPLYRVASGTGRECRERGPDWTNPLPLCGNPDQSNAPEVTGGYREAYTYDRAGNLTRVRHTAGNTVWARQFALVSGTNRLRTLTVGPSVVPYSYDANGNLVGEGEARHFEWDHEDRLKAFRTQTGTAEPSVHARYLYDAAGRRVKKLVRKQGGAWESTVYLDGVFEHHRWDAGTGNNWLHVMDGTARRALLRIGPAHPDDRGPASQFHFGDHLDNSALIAGADGGFVNREEFTPYGETSFGGFGRKRYRFTGKERDEESGLSHHGLRQYSPGLARWISCDPLGPAEGLNAYVYAGNCPTGLVDHDGAQAAAPRPRPPAPAPTAPTAPPVAGPGPGPPIAPTAPVLAPLVNFLGRLGFGAQVVAPAAAMFLGLENYMRRSGSIARYHNTIGMPSEDAAFPLMRHARALRAQPGGQASGPAAQPAPSPVAPPAPHPVPVPEPDGDQKRRPKPEVMIDSSALRHAFNPAYAATVHAAIGGRSPVVSPHTIAEYTHGHPGLMFALLPWLWLHGARVSALSGNAEAIKGLNRIRHPQMAQISDEDAAVVASAVAENLDLVTGDKDQARFVNHVDGNGVPHPKPPGWPTISAEYYAVQPKSAPIRK